MPTLGELRAAHEATGAALRDATDRLGRARDEARESIRALADLEMTDVRDPVDQDEIRAARDRRSAALAALAVIRTELKPMATAER